MKKLILGWTVPVILLCFTVSVKGQNFSLDACDKYTERSTNLYKSAIFNTAGINLNKYDWSKPTLNCHINSTMLSAKKANNKKIGAIVSVSVGGAFLIGGATMLAQTGSSGGAALTALGSAGICGSVPLFIFQEKIRRNVIITWIKYLDIINQKIGFNYKHLQIPTKPSIITGLFLLLS